MGLFSRFWVWALRCAAEEARIASEAIQPGLAGRIASSLRHRSLSYGGQVAPRGDVRGADVHLDS
jgi:hypothetical protein